MALDLLRRCPRLAVTQHIRHQTFLQALASIPSAFPSGCQLSLWERWIYNSKGHIELSLKSIVSVICYFIIVLVFIHFFLYYI